MHKICSALILLLSLNVSADQPYVHRNSVGKPWGEVKGITMFRGNPTRTWYGTGPMSPNTPKALWRYPDYPMSHATQTRNGSTVFTGSGWTGQPVVWERSDGVTEVIVGAYDKQVHFINAETGKKTRQPFPTGDLIKGSVTLDPDGFPLLYFGSCDNYYRILALEGDKPRELWRLDAHADVGGYIMGNNDWDGNGAIINDHLFIGGENGWIYIFKLNRHVDKATGKVSVNPKKVVQMPGWDPGLSNLVGDRTFSIEASVAVFENRAYFANSAGYVIGIDYTKVNNLIAEKVFEFWAGDDIDGTPVVDEKGMLYIVVEHELDYGRAAHASAKRILDAGQIIKLDPYKPHPAIHQQVPVANNPSVLWRIFVPPNGTNWGGVWATPALDIKRDVLYVPTHPGDLIAIDRNTGKELWRKKVGYHQWSSPLIIDDKLLIGHCSQTGFSLWDVSNPLDPISLWNDRQTAPGGCIESTPAVWKGKIYVGSRDGYIYAFGDK